MATAAIIAQKVSWPAIISLVCADDCVGDDQDAAMTIPSFAISGMHCNYHFCWLFLKIAPRL